MNRRAYFRIHEWTGLISAALVVLVSVTGGILLFREQFKTPPPVVTPLADHATLEYIVEQAAAQGDGSPATDISLPLEETDPYVVWLDDDAETVVYLDASGTVVQTRQTASGWTRWLFRLHTGEIWGALGRWLMVVASVGLILLAWTGLSMTLSRLQIKRHQRRRQAARQTRASRD